MWPPGARVASRRLLLRMARLADGGFGKMSGCRSPAPRPLPLPPSAPVAPNRQRLVILGLILAIAAGIGAVLAAEQFDETFHDVDDLRTFTNVPVLASIPKVSPSYPHRVLRPVVAAVSIVAVVAVFATLSIYAARGNEEIVRMLVRGA